MCTRITEVLPHHLRVKRCELACFVFTISRLLAFIHSTHLYRTVSHGYNMLHWQLIVFAFYSDVLTKHSEGGKQFGLPAQTQCSGVSFLVSVP